MSDVTETLQQLLERRLREMGKRRGRGESVSLNEVFEKRMPLDSAGKPLVSYETVRRIRELGHHRISDKTADALATMLDVPVGDVLRAAGQRPRLGRFELPQRADRLNESERGVVLAVIDAILAAADSPREQSEPRVPVFNRDNVLEIFTKLNTAGARLNQHDLEQAVADVAARRTSTGKPSTGQQRRRDLAKAGEESQDDGGMDPA